MTNASGIIIVHNHPAGGLVPYGAGCNLMKGRKPMGYKYDPKEYMKDGVAKDYFVVNGEFFAITDAKIPEPPPRNINLRRD